MDKPSSNFRYHSTRVRIVESWSNPTTRRRDTGTTKAKTTTTLLVGPYSCCTSYTTFALLSPNVICFLVVASTMEINSVNLIRDRPNFSHVPTNALFMSDTSRVHFVTVSYIRYYYYLSQSDSFKTIHKFKFAQTPKKSLYYKY